MSQCFRPGTSTRAEEGARGLLLEHARLVRMSARDVARMGVSGDGGTYADDEESVGAQSWADDGRDPDGEDEADVRAHDYGLDDYAVDSCVPGHLHVVGTSGHHYCAFARG